MADSTTAKSLIAQVRTLLHEYLREFFLEATTHNIGTTTTFKINVSHTDDSFNEMEILCVDGNNAGLRGEIIDWVSSTKTGTVLEAFPFYVDSGVTVQIGTKGFYSDFDFVPWFNNAADYVFQRITSERLAEYWKTSEVTGNPVSGQNYGEADLPTDYLKLPFMVWVDDRVVAPLRTDESEVLYDSTMIDRAYIVLSGQTIASEKIHFKPKPDTTATVKYLYVPRPDTFTLGDSVNWPRKLLPAIVNYVAAQACKKRERYDFADKFMEMTEIHVKSINEAA